MKDVMCLYEMGIPAISPSSESTFIPDKVLEQLKKRFKRIIILFDRDEAGVKYLRKMSLKTGLEGLLIHKKFKAKDVSDAIKANDLKLLKIGFMKTLKDKLKTFWKGFRKVIVNLIYIPFILATTIVTMITLGACKLTDMLLQLDDNIIETFGECIYGAKEEIGKSTQRNS